MEREVLSRMFTSRSIGFVSSPYKDASEIPKGLGAKHEADGVLKILPEFELGLTDIKGFSHVRAGHPSLPEVTQPKLLILRVRTSKIVNVGVFLIHGCELDRDGAKDGPGSPRRRRHREKAPAGDFG